MFQEICVILGKIGVKHQDFPSGMENRGYLYFLPSFFQGQFLENSIFCIYAEFLTSV